MRDLSSGPLSLRSLAKLTLRSEFGSQWMWMSEAITTAQARALRAIDSRATPTPPTLTDSPSVAMCAACAAEPQGCGWADDRPGSKNTARLAISAHLSPALDQSERAGVGDDSSRGWVVPATRSFGWESGFLAARSGRCEWCARSTLGEMAGGGGWSELVVPFRGVRMLWDGGEMAVLGVFVLSREARGSGVIRLRLRSWKESLINDSQTHKSTLHSLQTSTLQLYTT